MFNGPFSGTTRVSRYQKGKTNLNFTEARDSEWQWHQLGHMKICTSLQTDNNANTPPLCFLQAGCPSCRPTSSIKALKAIKKIKLNKKHFSSGQKADSEFAAITSVGSVWQMHAAATARLGCRLLTVQHHAALVMS